MIRAGKGTDFLTARRMLGHEPRELHNSLAADQNLCEAARHRSPGQATR
jgi:hypothetical protein